MMIIVMTKMMEIGGSRRGGGYGGCNPPFKFQKKKRVIKQNKKIREKELHVCLVFMCTRVGTCINKHFSFKIFLLNPHPSLKNFWILAWIL